MTGLRAAVPASIPSPTQGVWDLGFFPVRAYALCILLGIVVAIWLGDRRWRQRGGREGQVLDIAALGDLQLVLALVVLLLQLGLGDLDIFGDLRRVEAHKGKTPVLRGPEQVRMLVVERLQLVLARLPNIGNPRGRECDDIGGAFLVAVAIEQIDSRLRRRRTGACTGMGRVSTDTATSGPAR